MVHVLGELGAGKTTFVRGACRALGVASPSPARRSRSPTATTARDGLLVAHLDLYRSSDPAPRMPSWSPTTSVQRRSPSSSGRRRDAVAAAAAFHGRAVPSRRRAGGRSRFARERSSASTPRRRDTAVALMLPGGRLLEARDDNPPVGVRSTRSGCSSSRRGCSRTAGLRFAELDPSPPAGPGLLHRPSHRARDGARHRARGTARASSASRRCARSPSRSRERPARGDHRRAQGGGVHRRLPRRRGAARGAARLRARAARRDGSARRSRRSGGRRRGATIRGAARRRRRRRRGSAERPASPQRGGDLPARGRRRVHRGGARVPARPRRREASELTTAPATLEIRALAYSDLPAVAVIERQAFPTPWSIAMFVLEMSKPAGLCLAAMIDGALVGYTVCSRYDTVWHVMNVAVDPALRRRGIASALLSELYSRARRRAHAVHARGAPLEQRRDRALPARRLPHRRPAPALLPGQRRGRADHVAHAGHARRAPRRRPRRRPRRPSPAVILALETSCDDTCAALVGARRRDPRQRDLLTGGPRRFGGVVPEIAARHHLELIDAVIAEAFTRAGAASTR